jgi:acyl-CoA reductase-like NAD-dependent aldehyde dehydrogenase
MTEPWQNRSPGDLRICLNEITPSAVEPAITASSGAYPLWSSMPLETRWLHLQAVQADLESKRERLAYAISLETGKTLTEARAELGAVINKFTLTYEDALEHLSPRTVIGGPHPAEVRHVSRGPAAVIGPFNFPLHLANGAIIPHLLAGNTVIFKPSPVAANVAALYAACFQRHLPDGVFELIQGGASQGLALCSTPDIRSICFTGSAEAGAAIARATAGDFSKNIALELGGKNALMLLEDGDPIAAAKAAAIGICSGAGQRCNATSRAIIHTTHLDVFCSTLVQEMQRFQPGDPCSPDTNLGTAINRAAHQRYADQLHLPATWLLKGSALDSCDDRPGYYVCPAARLWPTLQQGMQCPVIDRELFVPLIDVFGASNDEEILQLHNATPHGLTASIYTASRERFESLGRHLRVGNLYANLPTTQAPSTLPFGGLGTSGNGKPAGRGFIRWTVDEQAVQFPSIF